MYRSIRSLLLPVLLGIFFVSFYLLTGSSDLKHNGDTVLRYQTTQAIVDHGRIWIADPASLDTRVARGTGGHLYAFYAPGQAVLMIPLYLAGKFIAHHLDLPYDVTTEYAARSLDLFLGAALAVLFFLMARSLGYSALTSVVLTLVFGLATTAWPDAQSALEQTQVDLFLLLAVYGLWRFVASGLSRRAWLVFAGIGLGLALLTRYDAALYIPLIAAYLVVERRRSGARKAIVPDLAVLGAAVAPAVFLVALWNLARFGSPFLTGLHEQTFGEPFWVGLGGLLVSPGKGLVWYLPLMFLLPWSVPEFYRRFPSLTVLFGALLLIPLLFYANIYYWHGDPAWGPRYLYTALPYLVLPLGELFERWKRVRFPLKAAAVLLIGISFTLQLSAVSVNQWRFWYRLEAAEQKTSDPFYWGARHYHYYWNIRMSPIVIQPDNLYQVMRLLGGAERYRLTAHPGPPTVSNPADSYPINTLAFWWTDPLHPLLGPRARAAIALGLGLVALAALAGIAAQLRMTTPSGRRKKPDLALSPAARAGG